MRSRETCSIQCLEFSGQGAAVEEELIPALVPGQSDSCCYQQPSLFGFCGHRNKGNFKMEVLHVYCKNLWSPQPLIWKPCLYPTHLHLRWMEDI